jgi:hypothetical protein
MAKRRATLKRSTDLRSKRLLGAGSFDDGGRFVGDLLLVAIAAEPWQSAPV